jgi:hypothetical protein
MLQRFAQEAPTKSCPKILFSPLEKTFFKKEHVRTFIKLGRYKNFHNDSDTIRYRINYLKVGIFDIDTKKNLTVFG